MLVTDHRPLIHLFETKKKSRIKRRSAKAEYLAQFTNKIIHISGKENVVADHLSRPESPDVGVTAVSRCVVDFTVERLVEEQKSNAELAAFKKYPVEKVKINDVEVVVVVIGDRKKPFVLKKLRFMVYNVVHGLAHPGRRATIRMVRDRYFWPKMKSDLVKWQKACHKCQLVKINRHTKSALGKFPLSNRLEHVHTDIVILKNSQNYRYLCTFIDRATRWIEAVPLQDINAETVARAFVDEWVARYGVPLRLTSDRRAQFTSELFEELIKLLVTRQIRTTAYNPKANGAIERVHKRLKEALSGNSDWKDQLGVVLMGLRAVPHDESGVSCAKLLYGENLRLPGEFFASLEQVGEQSIFVHPDLQTCKRVYVRIDRVRAPLEPPYEGPFEVLKQKKKNGIEYEGTRRKMM